MMSNDPEIVLGGGGGPAPSAPLLPTAVGTPLVATATQQAVAAANVMTTAGGIIERSTNEDGSLSVKITTSTPQPNGYREVKIEYFHVPPGVAFSVNMSLDQGDPPSGLYMTKMEQQTLPPGTGEVMSRPPAYPTPGNETVPLAGGGGAVAPGQDADALYQNEGSTNSGMRACGICCGIACLVFIVLGIIGGATGANTSSHSSSWTPPPPSPSWPSWTPPSPPSWTPPVPTWPRPTPPASWKNPPTPYVPTWPRPTPPTWPVWSPPTPPPTASTRPTISSRPSYRPSSSSRPTASGAPSDVPTSSSRPSTSPPTMSPFAFPRFTMPPILHQYGHTWPPVMHHFNNPPSPTGVPPSSPPSVRSPVRYAPSNSDSGEVIPTNDNGRGRIGANDNDDVNDMSRMSPRKEVIGRVHEKEE